MSMMKSKNPTPIGKSPSDVRSSSLEAVINCFSRSTRSLSEPSWPRPPARVTAIASGAVAEPPICAESVVRRNVWIGCKDLIRERWRLMAISSMGGGRRVWRASCLMDALGCISDFSMGLILRLFAEL
jgi:hypothetical protein